MGQGSYDVGLNLSGGMCTKRLVGLDGNRVRSLADAELTDIRKGFGFDMPQNAYEAIVDVLNM